MIRNRGFAAILFILAFTAFASAKDRRPAPLDANGNLDALIAKHAAANNLPEQIVRRVIKRESGGNPRLVSKGNYGLMQIRLGTARALGYRGDAAGLLDADTNMTYAVKYLAGAYRVAGGNADRAVHYYAAGYYDAAKRHSRASSAERAAIRDPKSTARGQTAAGTTAAVERASTDAAEQKSEEVVTGDNASSAASPYAHRLDVF